MAYFNLAVLVQQGDGMSAFGWLAFIGFCLIVIAAWWKVYAKAGEPGWAVLIPIYNLFVMLRIVGRPWWWLLVMLFVPLLNIIFMIIVYVDLARVFGKGVLFGIGLFILNPIFILLLGFGDARYQRASATW